MDGLDHGQDGGLLGPSPMGGRALALSKTSVLVTCRRWSLTSDHIDFKTTFTRFLHNYTTITYSLRFKTKFTFGQKLCYEIKVPFGEMSLKLCQTNWDVA